MSADHQLESVQCASDLVISLELYFELRGCHRHLYLMPPTLPSVVVPSDKAYLGYSLPIFIDDSLFSFQRTSIRI